ncbi:serine/threonine-protein kinase [Planomonospora sp. ID82291]|uniref:serine/threonine-protein kinase n=1 Tax=Planomonospora sp. ID82291 TaxID=2738136 RepID=UPI0018C43142|nr:serine/threonine-protein kinase [Planomonospora sp. ID82291]MBG0813222.1 serine/threonine protein kinase [Planomonospora sp. ID82291]
MSRAAPLTPSDPRELAGYRITGRLDDARPQDAYLAEDPSGSRAVIRLLPPGADPERFLRTVEPLRGMSAFGVAQVLGGGFHDDRPYIVSEHVEGATLAEAVAADGTLRGAALDRLAIGTMAALAAVHRSGAVHGDIRPETVVLGSDGPVVVDFGLAGALAAVEGAPTRSVGLPAYQAPERLDGAAPAPPADVFAWAATVAFAATGAAPFGGGTVAATINRILHDEPDLSAVPGELGDLLAECLAKDPADRPAAGAALLRLVGEESLLETATAIATGRVAEQPPVRPPGGRLRRALLLGGAFLAVAAVSGAAVYLAAPPRPAEVRRAAATASPGGSLAPAPTAAPVPATTAQPTSAAWEKVEEPSAEVRLDGTSAVVHEHPSDPVRLSAYLLTAQPFTSYLRERSGSFREVGAAEEAVPSPDGRWVALNPWLKFTDSDQDRVRLSAPAAGERFAVDTVKQPLRTMFPVWSRDGSRLLLSILDPGKDLITGFVLVDPAARTAAAVQTEYFDNAARPFTFMPDGRIARAFSDGERIGINVYGADGRVTRSLPWVGAPQGTSWFSPSGALFATYCPRGDGTACVWSAEPGNRRATVALPPKAELAGWFNEQHLIVRVPHKKGTRLQLVDLTGAVARVLVDMPKKNEAFLRFDPVAPR